MHMITRASGLLARRCTTVRRKRRLVNLLGGAVVTSALLGTGVLLWAGFVSLLLPTAAHAEIVIRTWDDYDGAVTSGGRISTEDAVTFTGTTPFTIQNSKPDGRGGVVNASGGVTLENPNVTYTDNATIKSQGGVVYSDDDVTISGGTFTDNSAALNGGVAYGDGDVSITGGTFTDNSAKSGGVLLGQGIVSITGGIFEGNKATIDGGAIYNGKSINISSGAFTNNSATRYGGAVFSVGDITLNPGADGSVSFTTASDNLWAHTGAITINDAGTVSLFSAGNHAQNGVSMQSGTLNLGAAGVTNSAVFDTSTAFTMTDGTVNANTTDVFGKSATINGGTLTLNAAQNASNITLNSGTINANAAGALTNFTQSAGTVNANASKALSGTTTMTGGTLNANKADAFTGTTTVNGGQINYTAQATGTVSGVFQGNNGAVQAAGISRSTRPLLQPTLARSP